MSTSQPLKKKEDIQKLKNYFHSKRQYRNYVLIIMGLNTALRISDLLQIKWKDVYDDENHYFYSHIFIVEKKTKKENYIMINTAVKEALLKYKKTLKTYCKDDFIFINSQRKDIPISRVQAYRIIKKAVSDLELNTQHISCHSLRKTFGYQAWKEGTEPALLMMIFNHSSYHVTKRYLCIDQDDKDNLFMKINL